MNKTIENLKKLKSFHNGSYGADIDEAIKAIEQQPSYNSVNSLVESKLKNPKAKTFDILHFIADNAGLSTYEAIEKAYIMGASGQEPCEDCISRQTVIDVLKHKWNIFSDANDAIQESINTIEALPPVTPQPKTGQWVNGEYCSECGCDVPTFIIDWRWQEEKDMDAKYCPNCGIKMKGKSEEV